MKKSLGIAILTVIGLAPTVSAYASSLMSNGPMSFDISQSRISRVTPFRAGSTSPTDVQWARIALARNWDSISTDPSNGGDPACSLPAKSDGVDGVPAATLGHKAVVFTFPMHVVSTPNIYAKSCRFILKSGNATASLLISGLTQQPEYVPAYNCIGCKANYAQPNVDVREDMDVNFESGVVPWLEIAVPPAEQVVDFGQYHWSVVGSTYAPHYRGHEEESEILQLPDGKVLIVGGAGQASELYNPLTGNWAVTGGLNVSRSNAVAQLLPNGEVLVAGGVSANGSHPMLASAEIWNPATGKWSLTGSMAAARSVPVEALLPNGKVLVAGGGNDGDGHVLSSAEVYDPTTGNWAAATSMLSRRANALEVTLADGRVLVIGGQDENGLMASAEIYDPVAGTWSATGSLKTARGNWAVASLLPGGRVLVAGGGGSSGASSEAEVWDPALGTWSKTAPMSAQRQLAVSALLPNGSVLVAGGSDSTGTLSSAELYSSSTGTWSPAPPMYTGRTGSIATLLSNGTFLVTGGAGVGSNPVNSTELYQPTSQ